MPAVTPNDFSRHRLFEDAADIIQRDTLEILALEVVVVLPGRRGIEDRMRHAGRGATGAGEGVGHAAPFLGLAAINPVAQRALRSTSTAAAVLDIWTAAAAAAAAAAEAGAPAETVRKHGTVAASELWCGAEDQEC